MQKVGTQMARTMDCQSGNFFLLDFFVILTTIPFLLACDIGLTLKASWRQYLQDE